MRQDATSHRSTERPPSTARLRACWIFRLSLRRWGQSRRANLRSPSISRLLPPRAQGLLSAAVRADREAAVAFRYPSNRELVLGHAPRDTRLRIARKRAFL